MNKYIRNEQYFLNIANEISLKSPDLNTKVGCVLKTSNGNIIKACNDFPKGIKITDDRLKRPEKYKWIEHAERNAILIAAKQGLSLDNSTMYLNWYPCIECARSIIQCGISKLVCEKQPDYNDERWGEQFKTVTQMLYEGDINVSFME